MKSIGENIKHHRLALGWSQADTAKKLKISTPAFCKIETDQTDINISRLQQIAKLFTINVNQLISGDTAVIASVADEDIISLKKELIEKEEELNKLRKKVIDLYDKLGL